MCSREGVTCSFQLDIARVRVLGYVGLVSTKSCDQGLGYHYHVAAMYNNVTV